MQKRRELDVLNEFEDLIQIARNSKNLSKKSIEYPFKILTLENLGKIIVWRYSVDFFKKDLLNFS
jgi:hypothetical protein